MEKLRAARILVVDDDRMTVKLLTAMMERAGYQNIRSTIDPEEALALYREVEPDLVLLDLHMPQVGGMDLLNHLHGEIPESTYLPLIVITGDVSAEAKLNALLMGAKDFITKPIDIVETMLRIRIQLETRFRIVEMAAEIDRLRGELGPRRALAADPWAT